MRLRLSLPCHLHSAAKTTQTLTGQNRLKSTPALLPNLPLSTRFAPTATSSPCCDAQLPLLSAVPSSLRCRSHKPTTPANSAAAVAPCSPLQAARAPDRGRSVYLFRAAAAPPDAVRSAPLPPLSLPTCTALSAADSSGPVA